MTTSLLDDIALLKLHVSQIVDGDAPYLQPQELEPEELKSFPHILLIELFLRVYNNEDISAQIKSMQAEERKQYNALREQKI